MGLDVRIQELAAEGLSGRRIAAQIKVDRPDANISDSAIIRYVSKLRNEAEDQAFKKIREHVDKVIPEDLDTLEEMEAQCLKWAREVGKDRIDRMAEAAVLIKGKIDQWRLMLLEERDEDGKRVLVKKIIRECLEIMAREDRLQIQRDKAMNTAIKIIEIKLRHVGLLDEEGKSPIYIMDRTGGKVPEKKDGFAGYKPYAIDGGKKDG